MLKVTTYESKRIMEFVSETRFLESPNRIATEKQNIFGFFFDAAILLNIKITLWTNFMSISFLDLALQPILCTRHLISNPRIDKTHFWVLTYIYSLTWINNPRFGKGGQNIKCRICRKWHSMHLVIGSIKCIGHRYHHPRIIWEKLLNHYL